MKFIKYIFIISFLLNIEIYKIICKPYTSWETSSSWSSHTSSDGTVSLTTNEHSSSQVDGKTVSEVNKSNTTVTKPDGSVIYTSSDDNSQPEPPPKPKTKKTSAKSTPTYVPEPPSPPDPPVVPDPPAPEPPVIPDPPAPEPPVIPDPPEIPNSPEEDNTPTTTTTSEPSTDVVIDETITNVCAEQCLRIYSKCRYYGTLSSLNDVVLDAIYPPPTGSFGDCLCKSIQNHIGYYYECAKCLQSNSENSISSITDQSIKSSCQVFETNKKNTDYNTKVNKMEDVPEKKQEPKKTGINKTNLIIICTVLGVGLFSFIGYKITKYIKNKRRETLLMY
ncbi:hypothetical protein LY90DRAFT_701604 [Neocallimastix californiae]|uniref:Uncharacterized protein n=1 Tax=Neocallimastix californiae TaxID=1754190 RepID=A0A1Y2DEF4_9FUNG|nr:hypothetical protein LY90DRAFT_701604 [Neocallimastix californiae]|eukprot:ORY57619.1 hypothetical protein LY90DRAFT_701604 [Neocallimastix californiae]